MDLANPANLAAVGAQIACLAVVAGVVMAVPRIATPGLRYAFWRTTLLVCLLLPFLQTPRAPDVRVDVQTAVAANGAEPGSSADRLAPRPVDWASLLAGVAIAGVLVRLLWIAVGLIRLHQLRRSGRALPAAEHRDLQVRLGTRAEVMYAAAVNQPVTFGVFSPIVLLPQRLDTQPAATREAVLTHELLHVQRRDWVWVLCEELLRAVFWFHPAFWWLVSRVQLAREELVDATAVAVTGRRAEYVKALLAFADDVPLSPAPAFARRRHLFRRIVLLSTEDAMSTRRALVSAAMLSAVVAASGWSAIAAFPMRASGDALLSLPGPLEQTAKPVTADNPIPRRLHAEEPVFPSEAEGRQVSVTVTLRTVVDTAGAVAEVRLGGLTFQIDGISASLPGGPDGMTALARFLENRSLQTSVRAERMPASTLRPLLEAFIESAATAAERSQYEPPREAPIAFNTIVHFLSGQPTTMRTVASVDITEGAIRVGGNVKPPRKVKDVRPVYPDEARDARVQGVVVAEVRVEPDGRVGAAQIVRSIPLLDQAALDAIRQWEFTPTLLNGVPVPVVMTVTVMFTLG